MSNIKIEEHYFSSGKLAIRYQIKNGQRHGFRRSWFDDGTLAYKKYYLYDIEVTEDEYRAHILIEQLAGI